MDQKQYVIIFSTAYLPFLGGAEIAVKEITDRLHDMNFILITARMRHHLPSRERIGNIEVYRVGMGIPFLDKVLSPFLAAWHVFILRRRIHVCLFWSVMVSYITITPVLLKMVGLCRNTPFLLTLQEGDSETHIVKGRFGLVAYWWRMSLYYANSVHVISAWLEKIARGFGYRGAIFVIPNGVDVAKFQISDFNPSVKIIITTSRLVEKNAIDVLIKAFAKVHEIFPDVRLHIVGDGPLRSSMEILAHTLQVDAAITFLGTMPNEEVPEQLAAAYMFVRPSRSEGLGISFLEAMAAGVPIIATPVGGIVDFLKDEETGLVCKVDDPQDLAIQIKKLFTNEALYMRLQENGRRLVEERYNWDMIAERMKTMFKNLCIS
ncbi:MAG: hypothetical protein A3J54_01325 [Candidatus Ryanbacteria bacterium RIFCSPHIGHO2_02_FULL_45_13b]|uniref:Glycosyl transferase family 1 domain-containing protein n=1 Tax=Candidatus Ryanbacteria bacterium RIFCSPHIGHO2_02_FULL_45_13b TaxID=1802117 RepID=A0A1G2GAE4_9BACT|nr:MAG: hypothetical protein A3J54_01325 [Candidatus Ryanbacteria bacterium RIFCSPHIGHO2_02_FULL_45_13b]